MDRSSQLARWLFPIAGAAVLLPQVSSAVALLGGATLALALGNPYLERTRGLTHKLLALSIVGLGAGMDLAVVGRVGLHGIGYTVVGILLALGVGTALGRLLAVRGDTGLLVSVGTAICGGSAIAAVAPAIRAKHHEVSVALATVFLLNAAGLVLFPWLGHRLQLSETQFGLWSALAIHDTSSVVGATMQYGPQALSVGATVKLARALWIVPVAFLFGLARSRTESSGERQPAPRPWFILGFVVAAALVTWVPALRPPGHVVESVARRMMILTLFLVGASLTRATLRDVGLRPLMQGTLLWAVVASATLGAVHLGWIGLASAAPPESAVAAPASARAVAKALEGIDVIERVGAPVPPEAVFTDDEERAVVPASNDGRPKLLSFNYSRCKMLCSLQLAGLAHALNELPPDVPAFEILTVGLDPSEPPAESARAKQIYVRQAGGSARIGEAWHFLHGTRATVDALAAAVGFRYLYDAKSREYLHPATLIVVTPDGRVSRYLHGISYPDLREAISAAARGEVLTPVAQSGLRGFLLTCIRYDRSGHAPLAVWVMRLGGLAVLLALAAMFAALRRKNFRRET